MIIEDGRCASQLLTFRPHATRISVRDRDRDASRYVLALEAGVGGVGMLGGEDLALPYPWIMRNLIRIRGQWMYDTSAVPGLVGLIRSGLLDLRQWAVATFPLAEVNEAVANAAAQAGPFKLTVLQS